MRDEITINIPKNIDNLSLPDPSLINYYKDLEKRIFWVDSEIDEYSLEIVKYIIQWNREDRKKKKEKRKPIKLVFFSPGGLLSVNNTLIDTISMSETPVYGINMGMCSSAAAYIFMSCHKRYAMPRSYFLLHQGSGGFSGTYQEVTAQMENYHKEINELMEFVKEKTTYTEDEIAEKIINEWYIYPEEAISHGLCDEIINSIDLLI